MNPATGTAQTLAPQLWLEHAAHGGGLFLLHSCLGDRLQLQQVPSRNHLRLPEGERLQLSLFLYQSPDTQRYNADAEVVTQDGKELVLHLTAPHDPQLQQLLSQLPCDGQPSQPGGVAQTAAKPVPGSTAHRLINSCLKSTRQFLEQRRERMLSSARQQLLEQAAQASNDSVQAELFDATQELAKVSPSIWSSFQESLAGHVEQMLNGSSPQLEQVHNEEDQELSLVDTQSVNDLIIIQRIKEKAGTRHEHAEADLRERLNILLNHDIDAGNNRFGVQSFCDLFHDALQNMGLGRISRQALFQAFERVLMEEFDQLLGSLNQLLAENNILPQIPRKKFKLGKPRKPAALDPDKLIDPNADPEIDPPGAETTLAQAPAPPHTTDQPDPVQLGPAASSTLASTAIGQQNFMPGNSTGTSHANAYDTARALFQLGSGVPRPAPGTQVLNKVELLSLLAQLRSQAASGGLESGHRLDLQNSLGTAIRQQFGDDAPRSIGSDEQLAINMVSQLVDELLKDLQVSSGVKPQLARLETNLASLALQDPSFLTNVEHPARQFINRMGQLNVPEADPSDQASAKTTEHLHTLVEKLAAAAVNANDFQPYIKELDKLLQRQQEVFQDNIKEVIAASEQQQKLISKNNTRTGVDQAQLVERYPAELQASIRKIQRLRSGDKLRYRRGGSDVVDMLAWISPHQEKFVFVDNQGKKSTSLGLQELAMDMSRGHTVLLQDTDVPPVERSIYSMFQNIQKTLLHDATHDQATGLANRKYFEQMLNATLGSARKDHSQHLLCYIALDNFQDIHQQIGDKTTAHLCKHYAELLNKHFSERGYIGKLGEYVFAVVLENIDPQNGLQLAEQHRYSLHGSRIKWRGETLPVSVSIGVSALDSNSRDAKNELQSAHIAQMKAAKEGGNRTSQYQAGTAHQSSSTDEEWQITVPRILEEDGLQLFRQLIAPVNRDTHTAHYEVLMRMKGLLDSADSPFEFIQAAERIGMMPEVDRWVIKHTLNWMADNPDKLGAVNGYAINLSGNTVSQQELKSYVQDTLQESGVNPEQVLFEITETLAIDRLSVAVEFINELRAMGCRFCLDDFGTGSSTYSYLKQLPVDYVKIDGMFIKDIVDNENDEAVVRSINDISHYLGKHTVAEYVENQAIADKLKEIGIDYVQGYGIEKPAALPT